MKAGGYSFGEDRGQESERLTAVEQAFDAPSRAALSEAGVQSGWHCWEVGAGRGSIANWLGETVGPRGRVLATDLDDRWFSGAGAASVEFLAHDLARDPPTCVPQASATCADSSIAASHQAGPDGRTSCRGSSDCGQGCARKASPRLTWSGRSPHCATRPT